MQDATEPQRGTFTFANGDVVANLAKANGQLLRGKYSRDSHAVLACMLTCVIGHNCVWHNQLPSWVSNGNFNATTLASIVANHCSTVVSHYKGQM